MVVALPICTAFVVVLAATAARHRRAGVADRAADIAFTRARSALRAFQDAAETEDDADLLGIATAYHLTKLLDLADVAWTSTPWTGGSATLHDDASILAEGRHWPVMRRGMPRCTTRALVADGRHFGWIVMTARPRRTTVSAPALHACLALCDGFAAGLALRAHPPIGHFDSSGQA
jgi:hypothetical protein